MSALMDLTCPHCGRVNEAHKGLTGERVPGPGDVSLCWQCGGVAIFTETAIRLPTAEEAQEVAADPNIRAARAAISESYTPSQAAALFQGTAQ